MIADTRDTVVHRVREQLSVVVYPLRWTVDFPFRAAHWVGHAVSSQSHLLQENTGLKATNLLLRSKLQKMWVLQKENKQLNALLQGRSQIAARVKSVRILAIQTSPTIDQFIINSGSNDGVYIGQPVMDGYGVMGQVVDVGPLSSRVLQITDHRFSIPVKDYENGFRAVASGASDGHSLQLENITSTTPVKVGDLLVTSGFALRFPIGYPVGKIISIDRKPGARFVTVGVQPAAHLEQSQQVLLAWPKQAVLRQEVLAQLKKPLASSTGGAA
jgi:rod shape-determining protein MreC